MCYGELEAANDIDKANLFNKYFILYCYKNHYDYSLCNIEI